METAVQPRSLKLTFKLKREDGLSNCSVKADHVSNAAEDSDALNNSPLPGGPVNAAEDQEELLSSPEVIENVSTEGVENPAPESAQNQLVLYDPAANGGELINPEPISSLAPLSRQHPFSNQTPRVLPSVGAFTVQCAECFKWRLIPTKEKYEEIREHIIEQPFMCEKAREWKPEISCEDPPDIEQDGSRLWAIDRPNIAQPPRGWQRLLRIRGEGSTKFADVYYVSPSGKRLRSMVEVQKYLTEYPSYVEHGVSLSQFSFQIPRPLQANYVRKRPLRATPPIDTDGHGTPGSLSQVEPIQWEADTELQLGTPGLSPQNFDSPATPEVQSAKKKKKTSSKKKYDGDVIYNQNELNMGGSSQL